MSRHHLISSVVVLKTGEFRPCLLKKEKSGELGRSKTCVKLTLCSILYSFVFVILHVLYYYGCVYEFGD